MLLSGRTRVQNTCSTHVSVNKFSYVENTYLTCVQHVFNTSLEIKYLVSLLIIFISVYKFIDIFFNVKRSGMVRNGLLYQSGPL